MPQIVRALIFWSLRIWFKESIIIFCFFFKCYLKGTFVSWKMSCTCCPPRCVACGTLLLRLELGPKNLSIIELMLAVSCIQSSSLCRSFHAVNSQSTGPELLAGMRASMPMAKASLFLQELVCQPLFFEKSIDEVNRGRIFVYAAKHGSEKSLFKASFSSILLKSHFTI